jgi:general secretion pathway protein D
MHFRAFQLLALLIFLSAPSTRAGSTGQSSIGSMEALSDREITRRQENIVIAENALKTSEAELKRNNIEAAYNAAKQAVDLIPDGSSAHSLRARALSRFSSTAIRYAEYLVSQGQYAQGAAVAQEVLEPRYNPNYRPAAVFLDRLDQPDYFNKTITPELAAEREQVENLINEAVGYYDSGRYDLAQKRYQQVLVIDKYNAAAFRGMEQVEVGKQRYYDSAYNETRSRMLWQVEKAWERPKRRFVEARTTDSTALQEERRGTELMIARLNSIIIPKIDFRDATIRQAVSFLQQQSRALDAAETGPDGSSGVNIVLKLPAAGASAPPPIDEFGEATVAPASSSDARISLTLTNVPLYEALRYVATLAGLKVKVEPFAVSIVPLSEPTDTLEQREFKVPPGFITQTGGAEQSATFAGSGPSDSGGPRLATRQGAKEFLESQGVEFPPGASANFIPGSSRLVVRNTAPNLDLIESLVDAAMGEQPTQVEIEAKFVEVSQDNLKELGFDWNLGPFSIGGSGVYGGGGEGVNGQMPFVYPGTAVPVGVDPVTAGLRSGTGALGVNTLEGLLNPLRALTGPAPGIFSIAGVFTNPQFQVVIRALNQKKGVDLMAAPKVTTKSGQKATISINRQFPYPQEFEPPQIPQSSGGNQGNSAIILNPLVPGQNIQGAGNDPIVTPSFPTDFTTRNLGVTLEVEPQIGPDGYTIDLNLSPEVVDFEGFINYGSPILAPVSIDPLLNPIAVALGQLTTNRILTENVINQPIFSTRKVTTNVSIWDGQTVALGGLIREDVQKINDKVPILGDIPLAGALFRSEVEQKIKSNLIVFVTARLMDAAGQLLRPEDDSDQEEIVEPLGLPPDLPRPGGGVTAKGFRQK